MGTMPYVLGLVGLVVGCASSQAGTEVVSAPHSVAPTVIATREARTTNESPRSDGQANADAAPAEAAKDAERSAQPAAPTLVATLPTTCATSKQCVPPREFATVACRGRYPSMALSMFEKHTPWQRLYVKVATLDAVNAYGDRSTAAPLVFGEEVLVLREVAQPKSGKLLVSTSDIDVLRWDGTCATVAHEAFSTTRMADLGQATIDWRYLEDPFQQALMLAKPVSLAYEKHHSYCRGSRSTASDPQCKKAAERLSEAIGFAVRAGLTLPVPAKLPAWAKPEQVKTQETVAMSADADD